MMDIAKATREWVDLLNKSEWWTREQITEHQERALKKIILHHAAHNTYFKAALKEQGLFPKDLFTVEGLKKLKPMLKRDIQTAGEDFYTKIVPPDHKPVRDISTSGSTGEPIKVLKTQLDNVIWNAMTMRDHIWFSRDWRGQKYCAIKAGIKIKAGVAQWGGPVNLLYGPTATGPGLALPVWMTTEEQLDAVEEFQPDVINLHAGVLAGFVTLWERRGYGLKNLKHCKNISDTVSDELRERFRAVSGLEIEDNYSCSETGTIAIQCPVSGLYHAMEETQIIEVLDENGNECREGEIGRVVITDLFNTANPIIRYDINDYAQVGGACGCGRVHKTFTKVLGRERNLLKRPDGSTFWPRAGRYELLKIAPVRQWQIIQHSYDDIEFRIVTDDPLTEEQTTKIAEVFGKAINDFAPVRVTWFKDSIPPNAGGKFEESICYVK